MPRVFLISSGRFWPEDDGPPAWAIISPIDHKGDIHNSATAMINCLANYLPWRRFPLLGTWEVDLAETEERLNRQLPDKSRIQTKLQSIADDRWVFTRAHSMRKARDFGVVDPDEETKRRYWWAVDGDEGLYVSEIREDGQEVMFKIDLIEGGRFEFFEPHRGHAVVWKRA